MARVDSLRQSSHWVEELGEDVAMGAVCGFQGLSLSEAAVEDKEGPLVKGRYAEEEVMVAPATELIKIKVRAGLFKGEKTANAVAEPGGEADEAPAKNGLWQLPDEEVQWVLSWKRKPLRSDVLSADGVETFEAVNDMFEEHQKWMRREYEANGGVVLVDDDYVALREEHYKWAKEVIAADEELEVDWDESDNAYWNISDRLSDFYDSDEEEEVAQEAETN